MAAEVGRDRPGHLWLRYEVAGAVGALRLPAPSSPDRVDGLWRRTCFEAFVRAEGAEGYYEFNFAPSGQWAAYSFHRYRQGMQPAAGIGAPAIALNATRQGFELTAALQLDRVADLPRAATWRLGLSAVIEAADGGVSYWALAHPPGKADFHHADCFALELAARGER